LFRLLKLKLIEEAEKEKSQFQKAVFKIVRFLVFFSLALVLVVGTTMYLKGNNLAEILQFALILAIASIPVAFPTVLSVLMAISANKLSKNKAVVKNFIALEELAGVDILAVDKTGTLTKNKLTIKEVKTFRNFSATDLWELVFFTVDKNSKDVIDKTILEKIKSENISPAYKLEKFIPFDPVKKLSEAYIYNNASKIRVIKGAPQVIENLLSSSEEKNFLKEEILKFAENGFRALAVAIENLENNKVSLVGIIPMFDPPRDDSKTMLESLKKYEIKTKMITGDNSIIAKYIGKLLNIGSTVILAKEIRKKKSSEIIEKGNIFAEVYPEDKYHLVKVLQEKGHIVAMTGDGVNDAPALKRADIGIAVLGATPAARSAADVILLSSGLSVIKKAVEHTRRMFSRIKAYSIFRIAETIRIILFISISTIIFGQSPLTGVMIIILALLNDIPVIALAYDNARLDKKPMKWDMREIISIATLLGFLGLVSSFTLLFTLDYYGYSWIVIQSIMFFKMDMSGHSTLYTTRTFEKHLWKKPWPSLKFFIPAYSSRVIGITIVLMGLFGIAKIDLKLVLAVWVYSKMWLLLTDYIKVWFYKAVLKK